MFAFVTKPSLFLTVLFALCLAANAAPVPGGATEAAKDIVDATVQATGKTHVPPSGAAGAATGSQAPLRNVSPRPMQDEPISSATGAGTSADKEVPPQGSTQQPLQEKPIDMVDNTRGPQNPGGFINQESLPLHGGFTPGRPDLAVKPEVHPSPAQAEIHGTDTVQKTPFFRPNGVDVSKTRVALVGTGLLGTGAVAGYAMAPSGAVEPQYTPDQYAAQNQQVQGQQQAVQ